jgi:tetratricopeptide (TPR) repeat protein/DNA-binding CsgD family transcriptional regulator
MIKLWKIFFSLLLGFNLSCALHAGEVKIYVDSIGSEIRQTQDEKLQIKILLDAADNLESTNPDQAMAFASRALEISESIDYPEYRLQALIKIGRIQAYKTEFTLSLEKALLAKELAIQLEDNEALAEIYLTIGMIKFFEGNYNESVDYYYSALKIFEKLDYKRGIIQAMNGIGNTCYYQYENDKAYDYYNQALKLARSVNDSNQVANVLNNIGLILHTKGESEEAVEYYKEAININGLLGLQIRLATNYTNIGSAFLKLNNIEDFFANYNKAIDIFTRFNSWHSLALCYMHLKDYYKLINDEANQLKYLQMAHSIGIKYNLRDVIAMTSGSLHDFYISSGNIDSAYKYSTIRNAQKDSINNEKSIAKLNLLEMEYNYDKQQKEDHLVQQRKNFAIIILTILIISGVVFIFLIISRNSIKTKNIRLEKQRLSDEIEFKNKEMTINVMNLIKKNELIVDISNRLVTMENKTTEPGMKQEILHLISTLQRNSKEEVWEEFEVRFKQVHSSFYNKLLARFPDLTHNELKLCALLRLNLSTKEICELSGQRPSSLDVARYRLRKKLGLANSTLNLVTFLSQV